MLQHLKHIVSALAHTFITIYNIRNIVNIFATLSYIVEQLPCNTEYDTLIYQKLILEIVSIRNIMGKDIMWKALFCMTHITRINTLIEA